MKVCLVSSFFHPVRGGVENQMYYIAKHLVSKGHEVDVFVSDCSRKGKIKERFEVFEGINIHRFKSWFKFSFSGIFFPGLFKAVKKSNADIFHVHGYRHPFNFINFHLVLLNYPSLFFYSRNYLVSRRKPPVPYSVPPLLVSVDFAG